MRQQMSEENVPTQQPETAPAQPVEEEISQEEELKLPFPNATVVRMMKHNMDKEKMIKKEVKIAMNKWLGDICVKVSKDMNKFPYTVLHLHEFHEATKFFRDLTEFDREKERVLSHLEAIKKDIERLERDLGKYTDDPFKV
ncbi:MAG: hypothetical protein HY519_03305 [Candidatus Aenigmarchaeota archaeon]|nr:hypothetical protein [Candidatus Aenigmarchaeota archaeon]